MFVTSMVLMLVMLVLLLLLMVMSILLVPGNVHGRGRRQQRVYLIAFGLECENELKCSVVETSHI